MMKSASAIDAQQDPLATTASDDGAAAAAPDPSPEKDKDDEGVRDTVLTRQARRIARNPCLHLWISLAATLGISAIGLIAGDFRVTVDAEGWNARGTLVGDRHSQMFLVNYFREDVFYAEDEGRVWDDLTNNVQKGWEILAAERQEYEQQLRDELESGAEEQTDEEDGASGASGARRTESSGVDDASNLLSLQAASGESIGLSSCEQEWYLGAREMFSQARLWPIWEVQSGGTTALSPEALFEICEAEEATQKALIDNDLCFGCDGTSLNGCHRPYSIVLYARTVIDNGMDMSCAELRDAWSPIQSDVESQWKACAEDLLASHDPNEVGIALPNSCPPFFSPAFVDVQFAETGIVLYTSSIFATRQSETDELFEIVEEFDRAGGVVLGAYDTQNGSLGVAVYTQSLGQDMILALCSALIIAIAMLVHTRSPLITLIGVLQVTFSFPVAFFFYKLIFGFDFFPFLNFLGVFVVFAIGADDVFVAFDKFKNARAEMPNASIEDVAAVAFPEAAEAMFVTTITTAVAFFATAICKVAPIKCFAVFLGLLILFDYILNVALIFPALCIYDTKLSKAKGLFGCCLGFKCRNDKSIEEKKDDELESDASSFVHRALSVYYRILHRVRWPLFVACIVAFGVTCFFATKLEQPDSIDVRLLGDNVQFEQNFVWRKAILQTQLDRADQTYIVWGVTPADTGDRRNPETSTQLVLDESFDPSSEEAQVYLLKFCPQLFEQEFASAPRDFQCAIERFNSWLGDQSIAEQPEDAYISKCDGSAGLPMSSDAFHPCLVAWSKLSDETSIMSLDERVMTITVSFMSRVGLDSGFEKLSNEWELIESWMAGQNDMAPVGINQGFFSSHIFRTWDSTAHMFETAVGSAAIALGASAFIILITSRSFVLTIFATLSVTFVLASVTSILVGMGWTLGYLESICFAVLIGISVDFVIHFSHAYSSLPGDASRGERTKHALISMGPSVLAGATTSMVSATTMLFTVIVFFQQFAYILLITVSQAVLGSFVVYLVMTDCIGPSNPTKLVDELASKIREWTGKDTSLSRSIEQLKSKFCGRTKKGSKVEDSNESQNTAS